jgi:hypothetical protein
MYLEAEAEAESMHTADAEADKNQDEDDDLEESAVAAEAKAEAAPAATAVLAEGGAKSKGPVAKGKGAKGKGRGAAKGKGQDKRKDKGKGAKSADERKKAKYAPNAARKKILTAASNPFVKGRTHGPGKDTPAPAPASVPANVTGDVDSAKDAKHASPAHAPAHGHGKDAPAGSAKAHTSHNGHGSQHHAGTAAAAATRAASSGALAAPSAPATASTLGPFAAATGPITADGSPTRGGAGRSASAPTPEAVKAAYDNAGAASGAPVPPPGSAGAAAAVSAGVAGTAVAAGGIHNSSDTTAPSESSTLEDAADKLRKQGFYAKGAKPHFGHIHPMSDELRNAVRFFHFSDTHVDPFFSPLQSMQPGVCHSCKLSSSVFGADAYCPLVLPEAESNRHLHLGYAFGRYKCNPPPKLMKSLLTHLSRHNPDPDFIVITGDLAPHGFPDDAYPLSPDTQLTDLCPSKFLVMQQHIRELRRYFPRTQFAFAMGNNDHLPKNVFWRPYMEKLGDMFLDEGFLTQTQHADFIRVGSYALDPRPGLRIVCPDFSLFIEGGEASFVPEHVWAHLDGIEQEDARFPVRAALLQWLRTTLLDARHSGLAVMVVAHQPLATKKGKDEMDIDSAHFAHLKVILAEFSDVIRSALFGHRNLAGLQNILGPLGEPLIPSITVPGISPRGNNQPVFHEVFLDPSSYQILEFEQWVFDLINENTIAARLVVESELASASVTLKSATAASAAGPVLPGVFNTANGSATPTLLSGSAAGEHRHSADAKGSGSVAGSFIHGKDLSARIFSSNSGSVTLAEEVGAAQIAGGDKAARAHAAQTRAAAAIAVHHARTHAHGKKLQRQQKQQPQQDSAAASVTAIETEAAEATTGTAGGQKDIVVATSSGALGRLLAASSTDPEVARLQGVLRAKIADLHAAQAKTATAEAEADKKQQERRQPQKGKESESPAADRAASEETAFVLSLSPAEEASLRPKVETLLQTAGAAGATAAAPTVPVSAEIGAAPVYVTLVSVKEKPSDAANAATDAAAAETAKAHGHSIAVAEELFSSGPEHEYLGRWGQHPQDLYSWRAVSGALNYTTATLAHFLSNAPRISRDFFAVQIWVQGGFIGSETPENFRCKALYDEEDAMMRCLFPEQDPRCFDPSWIK